MLAWSSLHLGIFQNSRVYKTFCTSLFGFLWQLEDTPVKVKNIEAWALRRLAPGPGNWIRPVEIHHMSGYGCPFSFPSFEHMSLAAKMRIRHYEPQIRWAQYQQELQELIASPVVRRPESTSWYQNSHVFVVLHAVFYWGSVRIQ